jgi:hypothetical protein
MKQHRTEIVGNFDMGECFAEVKCLHGHPTRLFNIGRDHFVACDTCRTYVHVGSKLMSSWKWENESIWQRNEERLEGYTMLE